MSSLPRLGLSLLLVLPACGEDATPSNDEADSGSTNADGSEVGTSASAGETGDAGTTSATDTDGTGSTDATDTGGNFDPVPARGISILTVEANQGIGTPIGVEDQWVSGAQRNARLVKDRDTLIRIHHQLDAAWTPREIEARLTITKPGAEPLVYTQRKEIVSDTIETDIEGGFFFGLVADEGEAAPGTQYQVSLWEVEPGGEAFAEQFNINPASGSADVGFESTEMEMNVMFVPYSYTNQGTTPDVSDPIYQAILIDALYEQKPVVRINAEFHAPVAYNGTLDSDSGVCSMLSNVSQLWQQEGSPSNVFYVGLIDSGNVGGVAGCAWGGSNISANVWQTSKADTANTIVHETGHDQGLSHVDCANAEYPPGQEPSTAYPDHPLGRIMATGFGVRSFSLYPWESTFDYMSYCEPSWVSEWTWGRTWDEIQQFTAQGDQVPTTPVLHHAIYPSGNEEYWTSVARLDEERLSALREVEFVRDGQVIARKLSQVDVLSDDQTIWITTPLPAGGLEADFDLVREFSAQGVTQVTRDQIRLAAPVK
jgi:hypothetical protein